MTSLSNARKSDVFVAEIETVKQISTVPTMLEVICRTTGMRFSAVARVTEDRWIACSVRDEIAFGLRPGGELKIETTICNKIRASGEPVIFDNIAEVENDDYKRISEMYGFQSYISFPIILKNGEFFGTLCAIDPKPAQLNNSRVIGLFKLFAELLSCQLHDIDVLDESYSFFRESGRIAGYLQSENQGLTHPSTAVLKEPVEKILMFSNDLLKSTGIGDVKRTSELASEINSSARKLTELILTLTGRRI